MSTWNSYDTPWGKLEDFWTWEVQPIVEHVSFPVFTDFDMDEDQIITVSTVFPTHADVTTALQQTLFVEVLDTMFAGMSVKHQPVFMYNIPFDAELSVFGRGGFRKEVSVSFPFEGDFGGASKFIGTSFITFSQEHDLDYKLGSRYQEDVLWATEQEVFVSSYARIVEEIAFDKSASLYAAENYTIYPDVAFGCEQEFDVQLFSWGRPVKPVTGKWTVDGKVVGTWTSEEPKSGNWNREDKI